MYKPFKAVFWKYVCQDDLKYLLKMQSQTYLKRFWFTIKTEN